MHAHVRAHWPVMEPNVCAVPAFHRIDRTTYQRVVSLGTADAMALLMWLYHSSMESFSWPTVASHRIQLLRREHVAAIVVEQHGECAETKLDGEAHMSLMLAATSRWSSAWSARDAGGVIPWAGRGVRVGAGHRASRPTRWSSVVVRCPIRTCA